MIPKNEKTVLRITTDMKKDIKEISEKMQLKEADVTRMLINSSIQTIKQQVMEAGGYDKVAFRFVKK